ncbi:hypothetical protein IV40_GL001682 [Lactobacillus selangorensis]|uniref:Integral membrane protein n=1 Tax=Lactobacillus selangorensis TaxID=81857 RepID=A0A0R2FRB8_9LACO|nr:hypothetical protein IV40_GL001682 [Lactobacillus selangorensis]
MGTTMILFFAFAAVGPSKQPWNLLQQLLIFTLAVLTFLGGKILFQLINRLSHQVQITLLGIILLLSGAAQFYVALHFIDYGRADSFFIRDQAIRLANHSHYWTHYFFVYPNNVNLVLLTSYLVRFSRLFGCANPWLFTNFCGFIWLDTGLVAGIWLLKRKKVVLRIRFSFLWLCCLPIYAYGVFSYSDPIIFPIILDAFALILLAQTQQHWHLWLTNGLLAILLVAAFLIKGNMIVGLIAYGLVLIRQFLHRRMTLQRFLLSIATIFTVLILGTLLFKAQAQNTGYQRQTNTALPATSWIMMSLNPKSQGEYVAQDAAHQISLPTFAAKQASEAKLIQKRLAKLGINGLFTHTLLKAQYFLTDGTFGSLKLTSQWQKVPNWYWQNRPAMNGKIRIIDQIFLLVLLLNCLFDWRPQRNDFLTLFCLGLCAFHILFWEVEPRYALPLLPILMFWSANSQPNYSCKLFIPALAAFSCMAAFLLLIIGAPRLPANSILSQQQNGAYFSHRTCKIVPNHQLTTTIQSDTNHEKLFLYPQKGSGRTLISIYQDDQLITQKLGTPQQLSKIYFKGAHKGSLKIVIQNKGTIPLFYGTGASSYPISAHPIHGHPDRYLRYELKK